MKIKGEFDVATNIRQVSDKLFKFVLYTEVENPNTKDNIFLIVGLIIISFLIYKKYKEIVMWRNYEKNN